MTPVSKPALYSESQVKQVATQCVETSVQRAVANVATPSQLFKTDGSTRFIDAEILGYIAPSEAIDSTSTVSKLFRELALSRLNSIQLNDSFIAENPGKQNFVDQLDNVKTLTFKSSKNSPLHQLDIKQVSTYGWKHLQELKLIQLTNRSKTAVIRENNSLTPNLFSDLQLPGIRTFRFSVPATLANDLFNVGKNIEILCRNNPALERIEINDFMLRDRYRPLGNIQRLAQVPAKLELSTTMMVSDQQTDYVGEGTTHNLASQVFAELLHMPNLAKLTIQASALVDTHAFNPDQLDALLGGEAIENSKLEHLHLSGFSGEYQHQFEQLSALLPSLKHLEITPAQELPV